MTVINGSHRSWGNSMWIWDDLGALSCVSGGYHCWVAGMRSGFLSLLKRYSRTSVSSAAFIWSHQRDDADSLTFAACACRGELPAQPPGECSHFIGGQLKELTSSLSGWLFATLNTRLRIAFHQAVVTQTKSKQHDSL